MYQHLFKQKLIKIQKVERATNLWWLKELQKCWVLKQTTHWEKATNFNVHLKLKQDHRTLNYPMCWVDKDIYLKLDHYVTTKIVFMLQKLPSKQDYQRMSKELFHHVWS